MVCSLDLVEGYGVEPLALGRIVGATLQTVLARALGGGKREQEVLNPWVRRLAGLRCGVVGVDWVYNAMPASIPSA